MAGAEDYWIGRVLTGKVPMLPDVERVPAAHFTVGKALLHFLTHEIHHRGQVIAMYRQLGHEPPEVDLI